MRTTLEHPDGGLVLEPAADGRTTVTTVVGAAAPPAPTSTWTTAYPPELIQTILEVKGPSYVCDELRRDEDPTYVELSLRMGMLSFVTPDELDGKRILDFGCGSGASTVRLAELFPKAELVGVELDPRHLEVARQRVEHYRLGERITFLTSPDPMSLPPDLGLFDAVSFSAVFEHLLPDERPQLLLAVWAHLAPGGILFVNQTPHRWFPLEAHTTNLPLINYLPDGATAWAARRFSPRISPSESWATLQRKGIRGATEREIIGVLRRSADSRPELVPPSRGGMTTAADVWLAGSAASNPRSGKRVAHRVFEVISGITRQQFAPELNLAIRKVAATPQV
jgi:predicted O-methyltransferase YrrM